MKKTSRQGNAHSLVVGVSVYVAVLITYYLASKNVSVYYLKFDKFAIFSAGISAAITSHYDGKKSTKTGFDRVWGTTLGIIIGYPATKLVMYCFTHFPYPLIFIPLIAGIGTYLIFKIGYKFLGIPTPSVGAVAFLGLVIQNPVNTTELYLFGRFTATLIGVIVAVLVAWTINVMKGLK
ncbi:FUSC family protein [Caviibacter abscessus]|uniref:FUSC family protein n=1 Tax=Caviibacter abscessus TaxID=1766719 RepID=UPI000832FCC5|nr:FUSC family protein [Caviibacter abscessus]